jgi:lysophospholipase L1-like esterase
VDALVMGTDATYPVSTGTPTVYVAGDSTVSTYTAAQAPQEGWGQEIQKFFTSDVVIVNKAIGGESSKSFADQGHLAEILAVIKPGDYLFAQWGINDRSVAGPDRATDPATTFRTYLKQYIDGAQWQERHPGLDHTNAAICNTPMASFRTAFRRTAMPSRRSARKPTPPSLTCNPWASRTTPSLVTPRSRRRSA